MNTIISPQNSLGFSPKTFNIIPEILS